MIGRHKPLYILATSMFEQQPFNCGDVRQTKSWSAYKTYLCVVARVCPMRCVYGYICMHINRPDLNAQLRVQLIYLVEYSPQC